MCVYFYSPLPTKKFYANYGVQSLLKLGKGESRQHSFAALQAAPKLELPQYGPTSTSR
jgi:hypothetical protein